MESINNINELVNRNTSFFSELEFESDIEEKIAEIKQWHKQFVGDGDFSPGRSQERNKQDFIKKALVLEQALNGKYIRREVYGTRYLWENLTGSVGRGRIIQNIVFAHLLDSDDEIKLNWYKGHGYLYWHTTKSLSEDTNVNISTAFKYIPELEKEGWFTTIKKQDSKGRVMNHYRLHFDFFLEKLAAHTFFRLSSVPKQYIYVYVVEAVGSRRFKIGQSKHPRKRFEQLNNQPCYPYVLRLIVRTPRKDREEKRLHEALKKYRVYGEWFQDRGGDYVYNFVVNYFLDKENDTYELISNGIDSVVRIDCVEEEN